MEQTTEETKPSIYCGTYAKYNAGSLKGAWMDLTKYADAEEFFAACKELHKDETDPEFMFQDFEGFPKELYSESMSTADAESIFNFLALDESEKEIIAEYAEAHGSFPEKFDDAIDSYVCTIEHNEDYTGLAEYYIDECCALEIPDSVKAYFDYEKYGRDLSHDHTISKNGFVFHS